MTTEFIWKNNENI